MRGGVAAAFVLAAAALVACGDEETLPPPGPADAEEIAAAINGVRHGWLKGDGAAVCDLLTERGRRITVRVARRDLESRVEASSCEEAVRESAAAVGNRDLLRAFGGSDYTPREVDVDPTDDEGYNEKTDSTEAERASRYVEVPCKDNSGNSWFAVRDDPEEGWRLMVPFCTGR